MFVVVFQIIILAIIFFLRLINNVKSKSTIIENDRTKNSIRKPKIKSNGKKMSAAAIRSTSARRFAPTTYENICNRCGHLVYSAEKIGPLKDFTFYHHGCFKCVVCGSKLTLKTYYNNQQDQDDKEVCFLF